MDFIFKVFKVYKCFVLFISNLYLTYCVYNFPHYHYSRTVNKLEKYCIKKVKHKLVIKNIVWV